MNNRLINHKLVVATITSLFVSAILIGCGGSTSSDPADLSGGFIADEGTVGSIRIELKQSRMRVSETSGFFVRVRNQDGAPVSRISISCDTEQGLAIIEPSTGRELTDSGGSMSGKIGCAAPGSFQMACRLPIGANIRHFVDVECEGDIPAGFDGFGPGTAGGGLGSGGGVVGGDDGAPGGVGTEGIRVTRINFYDTDEVTGDGSPTIDTAMRDCNDDPDQVECEPFFDTRIGIEILNNSNKSIRLVGYNYTVPNANGTGASFTSKLLQFSPLEIPAFGGEEVVTAFFTEAQGSDTDGDACNLGKRFPDSSTNIPTNLGFRTITFRIFGENDLGEEIRLVATATVGFSNYDNC